MKYEKLIKEILHKYSYTKYGRITNEVLDLENALIQSLEVADIVKKHLVLDPDYDIICFEVMKEEHKEDYEELEQFYHNDIYENN